MDVELSLLVALLVFAVPGALAVIGWDWVHSRKDRPVWNTLGYGLVISITVYVFLGVLLPLDMTLIVDKNDEGRLSIKSLVEMRHLRIFVVLCCLMPLTGVAVARVVPWALSRLSFSKSPFADVWTEMAATVARADREGGAWLIVHTKSGRVWTGRPYRLPDQLRLDDFIALRSVKFFDDEAQVWQEHPFPVLLVSMSDVLFIHASYPGAPRESNQEQPSAEQSGTRADSDGAQRELQGVERVLPSPPASEARETHGEEWQPAGLMASRPRSPDGIAAPVDPAPTAVRLAVPADRDKR